MFREAIDVTYTRLSTMPDMGSSSEFNNTRFSNMRMLRVDKRFENYLIFYQLREEDILIVRVLNSSRDIAAIFEEGGDREDQETA
jgi:plasmid stabilization system protein ParE